VVLGELIEEESGKIAGQRVLDVEGPKKETSFKMNGKFGGIKGSDIGTYCTVMREGSEPGVMYGEGQGVITTKDGQGMATWKIYSSRKNKLPRISVLSYNFNWWRKDIISQ
jgi:hypothetical protein